MTALPANFLEKRLSGIIIELLDGFTYYSKTFADCQGCKSAHQEVAIPGPVNNSANKASERPQTSKIVARKIVWNVHGLSLPAYLNPRRKLEVVKRSGRWIRCKNANDMRHCREGSRVHVSLMSQSAPNREPRFRIALRFREGFKLP